MRNNIVEEAIVRLIRKDRFFANLIMLFNRVYVDDNHPVKTAAVSITDKINLYIYPKYFENPFNIPELTEEQKEEAKERLGEEYDKWLEEYNSRIQAAKKVENPTQELIHRAQEVILIHECLHIINEHIPRFKKIDTKIGNTKYSFNAQAANIAMDTAINQLHKIEETVDLFGGITLNAFKEMIEDENVLPNETFEYYFNKMKQNAEKLIKKYGDGLEKMPTQDDHNQWGEGGENGEYQKEVIKNAVKKAEKNTGVGHISGEIQLLINQLFESKINWKQELRRFMQGFIKYTKKVSRAKRHRRYGIIFPGKKKKYHAHIAVAIDTSGSMSDEDLKRCFTEIHKIASTTDIQLTVIEADSNVTQVYPFDPKKEISVKGRGGTAYQPAFDKAIELGVNGIIYLGDMDAFDTPTDPNIPTLWGVIGSKQTPPGNFGKAIYIDTQTGEKEEVA